MLVEVCLSNKMIEPLRNLNPSILLLLLAFGITIQLRLSNFHCFYRQLIDFY